MKILHLNVIILITVFLFNCQTLGQIQQKGKSKLSELKYSNHLIHETSPYLKMHAHNPVDWYPWNEEAFNRAKTENKLIIISIGYSACHWCHVMEEESFSNKEVAKLMNDYFISIKVDREERPDIDQIYMRATTLLTGRGGWPLNVIALPDGRPVYGGTYFSKEQWMYLLKSIHEIHKNDPEKLIQRAENLSRGVSSINLNLKSQTPSEFNLGDIRNAVENWKKDLDFKWGGNKGKPKFPMPSNLNFFLNYYLITKDKEIGNYLKTTLDRMAMGGIYDQIGGGFARYSVDEHWKVPHFEKMLYDNGQLVSLYSNAWKVFKNPLYKSVVYQTLKFVDRELKSPEGGFYSSLDADSEGKEGEYYLWTDDEIDSVLKSSSKIIKTYYNVRSYGNWERGKNILYRIMSDAEFSKKNGLTEEELKKIIKSANEKLFSFRNKRIKPAVDDKILTSWDAIMLKGYIDAYRAFGDDEFLNKALAAAEFLKNKMLKKDFRLDRSYQNRKSRINAFLDDYAFTIDAFIDLYEATFDEKWIDIARSITNYAEKHFSENDTKLMSFRSDMDSPLFSEHIEVVDNVVPSSNSVMANCLFSLGHFFSSNVYLNKAKIMVSSLKNQVQSRASFFSGWAMLMLRMATPVFEIAITGPNAEEKRKEIDKNYIPNLILAGSTGHNTIPILKGRSFTGKTRLYLCVGKRCLKPVTSVDEVIKQINESSQRPN